MQKIIATITTLLLLLMSSLALALDARVDRTTLPENETLQLELSGSFSAFNLSIDLSPLDKDFRVLDNRRSTNMQYINGNFEAKTTLTVTLEPKKSGLITVPPITIEGESSQPIQLNVIKVGQTNSGNPNTPPPIDIEATLDTQDTWVQAQILLKIKLYQSVELFNLELLGVKELQQMGLTVEKIGENKTYQSKRNNITYHVTELNYVLFADTPGSFKLPEFIFEGQMPTRTSRYGRRLEARTDAMTINVKDIPKDYPSATWIPARDLQISDDLADNQTLELGDSINRNLVISVYGQEAAVIPNLPELTSDLVNVYADSPELNNQLTPEGMTGVRMDNIALISLKPGQLVLPEIQIPWFNTTTGKTEIARLPSKTILIKGDASYQPSKSSVVESPAPVSKDSVETKSQVDTVNNETLPSINNTEESIPGWFLLIFGLVCGIVVVQTGVILRLYQKTPNLEHEPEPTHSAHWDEPLPSDFVACFRIIQTSLQRHNLTAESLPDPTQSLIDRFRASHYGISKNNDAGATFSEKDREQLRQQLKAFFDSKTKGAQGPSLYPE